MSVDVLSVLLAAPPFVLPVGGTPVGPAFPPRVTDDVAFVLNPADAVAFVLVTTDSLAPG